MARSLKMIQFDRTIKEKEDHIKKIEVKPLLHPEVLKKDDSTISFVKRVGGQVFQMYTLKNNEVIAKGLTVNYNLLSSLYPITTDIDYSKHGIPLITLKVYQVKRDITATIDTFSSKQSNLISLDILKVIDYTYITDKNIDTYGSNYTNLVKIDLIDYIRYSYRDSSRDNFSATGTKLLDFTVSLYPLKYYATTEQTTTKITAIKIEVK